MRQAQGAQSDRAQTRYQPRGGAGRRGGRDFGEICCEWSLRNSIKICPKLAALAQDMHVKICAQKIKILGWAKVSPIPRDRWRDRSIEFNIQKRTRSQAQSSDTSTPTAEGERERACSRTPRRYRPRYCAGQTGYTRDSGDLERAGLPASPLPGRECLGIPRRPLASIGAW